MAILRYGAGQKYRERYDSGCEKGHKYHVRARFWNDSDQCGKQDHKGSVVADPLVDLYILQRDAQNEKHAKRPCEYSREVLLYDMVPEMTFHEMV